MTTPQRRALLAIALALTLAATGWVGRGDANVAASARDAAADTARADSPASSPRATTPPPGAATRGASSPGASSPGAPTPGASSPGRAAAADIEDLPLDKLRRSPVEPHLINLFAASTWDAPPPPAARQAAAPPPPPSAPPLPYAYFGRLSEEGITTVFLRGGGGERSHAVRVGDVLEGRYKIEEIKDTTMVLTYIPLQQQQILSLRP